MKRLLSIFICILLIMSTFSVFAETTESQNVTTAETESTSENEPTEEETVATEPSQATEPSEIKEFTAPVIQSIVNTKDGVEINWNEQEGAYKYRLFVKDGSSWKTIATTQSTSYLHKIPAGSTYTYTVRIVDETGKYVSPYNKEGYKNTYFLETPTLKSIDYVGKDVKITWKKVSGVTKYQVFYKRASWDYWKKAGQTTANSYTDTGLKNNITYVYTVRGITNDGSTWTTNYDHAGISIEYHSIPKITDISGANSGVKVTWKSVEGVNYYKVYYKEDGSSWKAVSNNPVTGTSYVFKDAKPGHKYTLTVKCANKLNQNLSYHESNTDNLVYAQTPVIKKVTSDVSDMTITWSKCTGAYKYKVFYYGKSGWTTIGTTTSTSFTYSDGYCDGYKDSAGGKYKFTVRCVDKYNTYNSGFNSDGYVFDYTFVPKSLKKQIKVPYFSQNELGAGCETYATTMLLNFFNFDVSPKSFANNYLNQQPASFYNGTLHGPSMDSAFCGNVYNGWGINAKGMVRCINDYLYDHGNKYKATAYTDKSLQYLCNKYVANGIPVLVWSTSQLCDTWVASTWDVDYAYPDDNKTEEKWYRGEHCLVLIGYDFPNRRYIYNDSLANDRSVGVSNWAKVRSEDRFETLGSQSIVITKK